VRFRVIDIIPHPQNPVTEENVSTADRLNQVVETARRAEELGFDSFSVGERHAGGSISYAATTLPFAHERHRADPHGFLAVTRHERQDAS
jgi:alkanesulfonate monooxygenase SsuD/methylene tetrahydromethanopterin reductase-like flavin-dependent oxidoreductase (luciferase family)